MVGIILSEAAEGGIGSFLGYLPFIIVLIGMVYFTSRSQKKQEKKAAEMRNNMEVGDEIVTVGGIVARVVKIEENTILVESSQNRSKLRLTKTAIAENVSAKERYEEERAKAKEAAIAKKQDKKSEK